MINQTQSQPLEQRIRAVIIGEDEDFHINGLLQTSPRNSTRLLAGVGQYLNPLRSNFIGCNYGLY